MELRWTLRLWRRLLRLRAVLGTASLGQSRTCIRHGFTWSVPLTGTGRSRHFWGTGGNPNELMYSTCAVPWGRTGPPRILCTGIFPLGQLSLGEILFVVPSCAHDSCTGMSQNSQGIFPLGQPSPGNRCIRNFVNDPELYSLYGTAAVTRPKQKRRPSTCQVVDLLISSPAFCYQHGGSAR